jgi:regulator of cell morphogenesis and NO signaling
MEMITKDMSMANALLENNALLPLLSRFGISLGFGEKTIEEVCREKEINPGFFLEIANAYLDENYTPNEDPEQVSLGALVAYLKSTHTDYLEKAFPRLEDKISRLLESSSLATKEKDLISRFFNDYKQEFLAHINQEEQEILPYILTLEEESRKEKPDPSFLERLKQYSIHEFAQEHDRLEYSLENLSLLIIKYLPPLSDQDLCIQVLNDLAALVRDLADHSDMEDKVLIPRVANLEETLRNR